MEKTGVLPAGVNHPSVRFGTITGIGDKYSSNGLLTSIGDASSRTFDSNTLVKEYPQAQGIIDALNQFGPYQLGDRLNLGSLNIQVDPQVQYQAGVFAHGFTQNVTVAVVVPVVVGSSRVDLQACKLEYSIVSPK